jgi:hypothetical protein
MTTAKSRLLVVLVFAIALLGGGAAGMLAARYASNRLASVPIVNASLSEQLQLTPVQQEQMRIIWQAMRDRATAFYDQGQAIEQERQDAYMQLLTDDQKKQYAKIHDGYLQKYTNLQATREKAFEQAVAETKKLLNDTQRRRYDTILSQKLGQSQSDSVRFEPTTASGIKSSTISPSQPLASPG